MTVSRTLFKSERQNWATPESTFNQLDEEFRFDHDPCPEIIGGLHSMDGLGSDWGKRNFVNPPYSDIKRWMKKAVQEWHKGKLVVCLVPSRTDTIWWHEYAMFATEIRFIKGRLKFKGATNAAPFPSVILVYVPPEKKRVSKSRGGLVKG